MYVCMYVCVYVCMYVCLSMFDFCIGTYLGASRANLSSFEWLVNITLELRLNDIFAIISFLLTKKVS